MSFELWGASEMVEHLKGKHFKSANETDANTCIETDEGALSFVIEGECCSSSWVESIEVPHGVVGAEIVDVQVPELRCTNDELHECLRIYECRIKTTRGDVVIDFRNSSNGYYGATISNIQWVDSVAGHDVSHGR